LKRKTGRWSAAAVLTVMICLSVRAAPRPADEPVFGTYYPQHVTFRFPAEKMDMKAYTHIYHAFLTWDADGKITNEAKYGNVPSRTMTETAHKAGAKVVLSLGGGNFHHFPDVTETDKKMSQFIERIIKVVKDNGYAGVDVDWEFPNTKEQSAAWSRLMRALRKALDKASDDERLLLTTAVPSGNWSGRWIDAEVLRQTADLVNVMSYDLAGPWGEYSGHHAPLRQMEGDPIKRSVEQSMAYWKNRGIPTYKLVVGLPAYGYRYDGYKPFEKLDREKLRERIKPIAWMDIRKLAWERRGDVDATSVWFVSPDGKSYISSDDPQTIRIKTKWARDAGYRGVFFWAYGQDMVKKSGQLHEAARKVSGR
jgi:chitinase